MAGRAVPRAHRLCAWPWADALPGWIEWVTYLSPFRFALNSLMVNEFDGLLIYFDPFGVDVRTGPPPPLRNLSHPQ
jgi:hypothetical protein